MYDGLEEHQVPKVGEKLNNRAVLTYKHYEVPLVQGQKMELQKFIWYLWTHDKLRPCCAARLRSGAALDLQEWRYGHGSTPDTWPLSSILHHALLYH